jgi:hypothetical protein
VIGLIPAAVRADTPGMEHVAEGARLANVEIRNGSVGALRPHGVS